MVATTSAKRTSRASDAGRAKSKSRSRTASTADTRGDLDLLPGLRDRILAELDASQVQPRRRIAVLRSITGRTTSTIRRWIDAKKPGLPDLASFARLCNRFKGDANYLLGLTEFRLPLEVSDDGLATGAAQAAGEVLKQLTRQVEGCEPFLMHGDEMAPRVNEGDILLVDRRITEIRGNGMYLLEYMGRTVVRLVEDRLGEGLVLSCANERYRETLVSLKALAGSNPPLRVLAKVMRSVSVQGV
jgi:hypothetical protein